MTHVIAEPCVDVMDKACVAVCPVDCIHYVGDGLYPPPDGPQAAEQGSDRMLYIDPDSCIDCGACVPECPVDAIFPEEDVPTDWAAYITINRQWFSAWDHAAARAAVNAAKPAKPA